MFDASMIMAFVAVLTLAWQMYRERKSIQQKELEAQRAAKMKIIADLVSLRAVLTGSTNAGSQEIFAFNRALGKIPIDFIDHKEVLETYHELGNSFTPEKFHRLITKMLESTGQPVPDYFSGDLLSTVPVTRPRTETFQ